MSKKLVGNIYRDFPEFYDLIYARYFKTVPDFVKLVERSTPNGGRILDLAAGTGEVTIPLLQRGYRVQSFDLNSGMLRVLARKAQVLGMTVKTTVADMANLDYEQEFDAVCIRQALNYLMGVSQLTRVLKKVKQALKPGGQFVFNAPNYHLNIKDYPVVTNKYEVDGKTALVLENNQLNGKVLQHRQHSVVWDGQEATYIDDTNDFYMFTADELKTALMTAGFTDIKFYGQHLKQFDSSSKTIYGVAR
jgi:ubiquinone/menaquinone biosynthesis C-methylase UbiE